MTLALRREWAGRLQLDFEAGARGEAAVQGAKGSGKVLSRGISRDVVRISKAAPGSRKEGFLGQCGRGDKGIPARTLLGAPGNRQPALFLWDMRDSPGPGSRTETAVRTRSGSRGHCCGVPG